MNIVVHDYVNVEKRSAILSCNQPTGFAILPKNFDSAFSKDELVYSPSTSTIRLIFQQAGVSEGRIEKEGDIFPEAQVKSGEWVGPVIFVGFAVITQNPALIAIALGLIANYLTDYFKENLHQKKCSLDIVLEKTEGKEYKKIHYEGSVEDLEKANLPEVIRKIQQDQ